MPKKISVVIPCFNEEGNIENLVTSTLAEFNCLNYDFELIFVDNCSLDETATNIENISKQDSRIKLIQFTRNFGPTVEASLMAGYKYSTGDAVVVLYADLQDPPSLIPTFIELWEAGFEVVNGIQNKRVGEALWRKTLVKIFYRLLNFISDSPTDINSGDFKLLDKKVVDFLLTLPEKARFNRGLIAWAGFKSTNVLYDRAPRVSGKSKANFFRIFTTAMNGITAFSLKPLRLLTFSGISITLISIIGAVISVAQTVFGNPVPGLTTIIILLLSILGLNMFALGILGEYLGRMQIEVKNRPLYVIDKTVNLSAD